VSYQNLVFIFFMVMLTGCASTSQSTAPTSALSNGKEVKITNITIKHNIFPEHSYPIGDSGFQLVQSEGGSIFLGPLLGSMNIAKNSKEAAQSFQNSNIISPYELAKKTLLSNNFNLNDDSSLILTPFIFLQKGDDGFFRLSLVHHVEDSKSKWVGRYTYHLDKVVKIDEFPSGINNSDIEKSFQLASQKLVDIMNLDFSRQLPSEGKKYYLGSLHLVGAKMGGLGVYTQPEEIYFQDAKVIQETNTDVIVRMNGNYNLVQFLGGLTFGVHYFKKSSLHKFEIMKKS